MWKESINSFNYINNIRVEIENKMVHVEFPFLVMDSSQRCVFKIGFLLQNDESHSSIIHENS